MNQFQNKSFKKKFARNHQKEKEMNTGEKDPEWKELEIDPNDEFDIGGIWTRERHHFFPGSTRALIKTILILSLKNEKGNPRYPQALFYLLPQDILYVLFEFIAGRQIISQWPQDYKLRIPKKFSKVVVRFGLGCTTMNPGSLSCGITFGPHYYCFHPGYNQGAFRCDFSGGNRDMGWTPLQNIYHFWEIIFNENKKHSLKIIDGKNSSNVYEFSFECDIPSDEFWDCGVGGCPEAYANKLRITFW